MFIEFRNKKKKNNVPIFDFHKIFDNLYDTRKSWSKVRASLIFSIHLSSKQNMFHTSITRELYIYTHTHILQYLRLLLI